MIRVESLRKSYGDFVAVKDISFEVEAGQTFGLLGPNGAGKSTTLHMLSGVMRPDAGRVSIDGKLDPTQPAVRRLLGMAPQALSIYDELTAEENLRFFGKLYGIAGNPLKVRVDDALGFAGLSDRARDLVKTYSGGMKRRLNLACALLHEPRVLFLDEPTVGVDPQSRNHLFDSIEELAKKGHTIVYTTHYMEEAQRLCRRVAIMDQGRILAIDTVDALVSAHGGMARVVAEVDGSKHGAAQATLQQALGAEKYTLAGNSLEFPSSDPFESVARLVQSGLRFSSLHVDRPDLEKVFLQLTGRKLRD